jgi:hypothetical protein
MDQADTNDTTYDGSGQPVNDSSSSPSAGNDNANQVNDQSQNSQQTQANLDAQQHRQAGDVATVDPAPGADPGGAQYNNPDNPPVETRPPEQTAPNEDTPGYEPQNP